MIKAKHPSAATPRGALARPSAPFSFGVGLRIRLGTILGRFSIIYFRGLGLRIRVRVWVRARARVRGWVRVRVSVVLLSWFLLLLGSELI